MRRPGLVWALLLGSPAVLDFWCDRNKVPGDTLSECTRKLYRTNTPLGRVAFVASWSLLTRWLVPHILKET